MRVLIAVSPVRWSPLLLDHLAQHRDSYVEPIFLYVIETRLIRRWARRWMAEGWLGQEATRRVVETILEDYRTRVDAFYDEIRRALKRDPAREVREGSFAEAVLEVAARYRVERIVMVRRVRPRWLRRFLHTEGEYIRGHAQCEVVSIEPDQ